MTDSRQPHPRRPYPSDLTDAQWRRVARLIPPERKRGRRRRTDMRDVVNAINYRWTTGCTWRMLPHDFPPWQTVYTYFRQWQRKATLKQVREVLLRRPISLTPAANMDTTPHQLALFPTNDSRKSPGNGLFSDPRPPVAEAAIRVKTAELTGHRACRT